MVDQSRESQISILIVEDVDEMRALLEETLTHARGLRVSGQARNGFEARMEVLKRRPDLVLLDEVLPGESGLDLLRDFSEQGIPVILITGMEEVSDSLPQGALARLAKPSWESLEEDRERMRKAILNIISEKLEPEA